MASLLLFENGPVYRRWKQYSLQWRVPGIPSPLSISHFHVRGAIHSGPIAFFAKSNSPLAEAIKRQIFVFDAAGQILSQIDWNPQLGEVADFAWTNQEHLIVISKKGSSKIFDLHGKQIRSFNLLDERDSHASVSLQEPRPQPTAVIECHFWENGVAVLTNELTVRVVEGFESSTQLDISFRYNTLEWGPITTRTVTAMTVVQASSSRSGFLTVYLATSDATILELHEESDQANVRCEDLLLQNDLREPVMMMALSPRPEQLALLLNDNTLLIYDHHLRKRVMRLRSDDMHIPTTRPSLLQWCGESLLFMNWGGVDSVLLTMCGKTHPLKHDSTVRVVTDMDCCRIYTDTECDILQKLPDATNRAVSVGETSPAALLFHAVDNFVRGDAQAEELIRSLVMSGELGIAVEDCIAAAAAEFDLEQQERLLRTASFGKAFDPEADATSFVVTAKMLRVLNAVREKSVGLPLTALQYEALTPEVLVSRLSGRNHHYLALRICEWLHLSPHRVLSHWACEKIRRMVTDNCSDEDIYNAVTSRLSSPAYGRLSYLAIAEAAHAMSRTRLATSLLAREPQPHDQIPLLLKMNQEETALKKAISSEATDLVYYTLITIQSRLSPNDRNAAENFLRMVHLHPEAATLLKLYYRHKCSNPHGDDAQLMGFFGFSQNSIEAGHAHTLRTLRKYANCIIEIPSSSESASGGDSYVDDLMRSASLYEKAGKDGAFFKAAVEEQAELVRWQSDLNSRHAKFSPEDSDRTLFTGKSLNETLQLLLENSLLCNENQWMADQVASAVRRFGVGEQVVYNLKIAAYSRAHQWKLLSALATEKKSPVGYRPFAKAAIDGMAPPEDTIGYIQRITDLEDRFELFMEIRDFSRALEAAAKLRDSYRLHEVGRMCGGDENITRQVQDLLNRL